jgi:phospholipid transport system substrate-binding protein
MMAARALSLLLLCVVSLPPRAAAETVAAPVVDAFHATLLGVMKEAKTLGYGGRAERLRPALVTAYDLPFMAEKTLGRHWDALSEEQRAAFRGAFERFTVANYASNFDDFSGQSFQTDGDEASIQDTRLVRTRLLRPHEEAVQLDYRLHKSGESWRIIDVYLDGTVSELARRRSEYSAVIKRDGFEGLLRTLEQKVAALEQKKS